MFDIQKDLECAILDCSVPLIAIRLIPPPVEDGLMVAKPEERRINFKGSFQPLTNKELQRLPEGLRNQGLAKIYTSFELKTSSTAESRIPDRVLYRNVIYQVDKVHDWEDLGGYFRVDVVRMGQ